MKIHRVRADDTVIKVAEEYSIPPLMLCEYNGIDTRTPLWENDELLIPNPTRTVCARRNETVERLSDRFDTSAEVIRAFNPSLTEYERIFEGQPLGVKFPPEALGRIVLNGYYYRGCSEQRLNSALNYLGFITLCAYKVQNGELLRLMDDTAVLKKATEREITPIMRVYLGNIPSASRLYEITEKIAHRALASGYSGVALSAIKIGGVSPEGLGECLGEVRNILESEELGLICEAEAQKVCKEASECDITVLTYDKLHLANIPSFEEGERRTLEGVAQRCEASRILVNLNPFAYKKDKYIGKEDALSFIKKRRLTREYDPEKMVVYALDPDKEGHSLVYESLENLKAKLALISELGYMGVSFDIARTPINELLGIRQDFGTAKAPQFFRWRGSSAL